MCDDKFFYPFQIGLSLLVFEEGAFLGPQFLEFGFYFLGQEGIDFLQLLILFGHSFECLLLSFFKHSCPCGFLQHREDFDWFHVEDFGDSTLHDEKVGVVDVELDRLEQVLDSLLLCSMTVDEVLALSSHHDLPSAIIAAKGAYLSSDADLSVFFKSDGRFAGVFVVKDNGDTGFGDACLTTFVDEVLQILCSDCAHVCYAEDKTYCVEDI